MEESLLNSTAADRIGLIVMGDNFTFYTIRVNEVPRGFSVFVSLYVLFSFLLIVPVSKLLKQWEKRRRRKFGGDEGDDHPTSDTVAGRGSSTDGVEMVPLPPQSPGQHPSHDDPRHRSSRSDRTPCGDQSALSTPQQPSGENTVSTGATVDESTTAASHENIVDDDNNTNSNRATAELRQSQIATMLPSMADKASRNRSGETSNQSNVGGQSGPSSSSGRHSSGRTSSSRRTNPAANPRNGSRGAGASSSQDIPDFHPGGFRSTIPNSSNNNNGNAYRSSEQMSSTPSAATTTRLRSSEFDTGTPARRRPSNQYLNANFTPFRRVIAMGGGWAQSPNVGRTQAIRGYAQAERRSAVAASEDESTASGRGAGHQTQHQHQQAIDRRAWATQSARAGGGGVATSSSQRNTSNAAGLALQEETVDGEADFYRRRYVERSRRTRRRSASSSAASDLSLMPPLPPEALSPEDAADADDPGRNNPFNHYDIVPPSEGGFFDPSTGVFAKCGGLFNLVEFDYDVRRILWLTIPSKLGAVTDPFLKLVLIAIISHFIDTQSMVAFVLVVTFVELTNQEISGAIADTEMDMIQLALSEGGEATPYLVGQYMQLALLMQILIGLPILLAWVFLIDDFVRWLLSFTATRIADLASLYTQVIIVDYLLQSATRTFMFPFHMDGRKTFEPVIDLIAKGVTMIVVGVLAVTEENLDERPTIVAVGVVQVIASCAKAIVKVAYVVMRGWFAPYQRGFFGSLTIVVSNTEGGPLILSFSLHFNLLLTVPLLLFGCLCCRTAITWGLSSALRFLY